MKPHKFLVGQHVNVKCGLVLPATGVFRITARLPTDDAGEPQYRVKALNETHERMVKEFQLAPAQSDHARHIELDFRRRDA